MQTAEAADMPVKAPPQVMTYTPNWTGFYAGVNVGALSARSQLDGYFPTSADFNYCWDGGFVCGSGSQSALGVLGGVQIGYNLQSGQWVYGLEADIGLSSAKKTATGGSYGYTMDNGIEAFGTARLRVGYAFDHALLYATGGLAYAKTRDSFSGATGGYSFADVGWRAGWTVGGGLEYMINRNWSVKGEALYYDLGSKNLESSTTNFGSTYAWGVRDKMDGIVARIGLNYLFH
jgi:outer membrane immunogenic protein